MTRDEIIDAGTRAVAAANYGIIDADTEALIREDVAAAFAAMELLIRNDALLIARHESIAVLAGQRDAEIRADERAKQPRVEIDVTLGMPMTCKVWSDDRLVFSGVDLASAADDAQMKRDE